MPIQIKPGEYPSEDGKRRYPPTGYYDVADEFKPGGYACTCQPACPPDCKGQCGCFACRVAWADYLGSRQD